MLTEFVMMLVHASPLWWFVAYERKVNEGPVIYNVYQESVYLGKQRRPWWDAAKRGVSSGSMVFV